MSNRKGDMEKLKGKAETQKAKEWEVLGKIGRAKNPDNLGRRLREMATDLGWEGRDIVAGNPEVEIVLHSLVLEERLEILEGQYQDLIDNLRFFMDKEEA